MELTPSWPEQYERTFSLAWREWCRPPVSWGSLIAEGREIAERLRAHSAGEVEGSPDPVAIDLLTALQDDLADTDLRGLTIDSAFHPRFASVFRSLPSSKRLRIEIERMCRWLTEKSTGHALPDGAEATLAFFEMLRIQDVLQWGHHGRRVYLLGRETAELLARTDLPNMPIGEVALPFASFYLRLPLGMYRLQNKSNDIPVDGVLVAASRTAPDSSSGLEVRIQLGPDTVRQPGYPVPWAVTVTSADRSVRAVADELNAALVGEDRPSLLAIDNGFDPIPNLVFGFALYLMSEHPFVEPVPAPRLPDTSAIKNTGKRRKKEQQIARHTTLGYIRVGRDPGLAGNSGTLRARHSLDKMVWVRGHWRQQAHGPARQLRRPTWIEPHVRGPDFADSVEARTARVQDARPSTTTLE